MTVKEAIRESTRATHPVDVLYQNIEQILHDGFPADCVLAELKEHYLMFDREGRSAEKEAVAEVMDYVSGFCTPEARLA